MRMGSRESLLAILLLVAIAAEALLPFMGRNLLTLAFLSASHRSPSAVPASAANRPFEFVGRLEDRYQLRRHHDLRAAARVARLAGLALANLERAESAD